MMHRPGASQTPVGPAHCGAPATVATVAGGGRLGRFPPLARGPVSADPAAPLSFC
jgi:hypothetical protein